jgi:hypothetical protein
MTQLQKEIMVALSEGQYIEKYRFGGYALHDPFDKWVRWVHHKTFEGLLRQGLIENSTKKPNIYTQPFMKHPTDEEN